MIKIVRYKMIYPPPKKVLYKKGKVKTGDVEELNDEEHLSEEENSHYNEESKTKNADDEETIGDVDESDDTGHSVD